MAGASAQWNDATFVLRGVLASSLYQHCGALSVSIASDERLRFCPTCLEEGFQSSIFQIDAFSNCPIHGDALKNTCPRCGAPTPRYAVEPQAFKTPMHCAICNRPFSEAWNHEGMVSSWSQVDGSNCLGIVEHWLQSCAGQNTLDVSGYALSRFTDVECRRAAFDVLRHRFPLRLPWLEKRLSVIVSTGTLTRGEDPTKSSRAERTILYKALRRHFKKLLGIRALERKRYAFDDLESGLEGPIYSLEGKTTPALHGFLLWRARFEKSFYMRGLRRPGKLELEPGLFAGPTERLSRSVNLKTWAICAVYALHLDIATAQGWAKRIKALSRVGPESRCSARADLVRSWAPDLYPWDGRWPRGLAVVDTGVDGEVVCLRGPWVVIPPRPEDQTSG